MVTPPRCNSSVMQHNRCQRYSYTRVPCQQVSLRWSSLYVSRRESFPPPALTITHLQIISFLIASRYNNAEKGYEDRSSDSIEVQSQCMPEVRRSILWSSCSHLVRTFRSILTRMVIIFLVGGEAPIVPMTYTIVLLHPQKNSFTNILFLSNVQYHH